LSGGGSIGVPNAYCAGRMHFFRFLVLISICCLGFSSVDAYTLTFVAQPIGGGALDDSWFNSLNWFTTDVSGNLVAAGRLPLVNETAVITGTVDLQASGVRVQELVLTNNAALTNGTLAVELLQAYSGTSIKNANVNVLTTFALAGTNCTISSGVVTILSIGSASLQAISPSVGSSLILDQGAVLQDEGLLSLAQGAQING